jgi:hypothetical protein
MNVGEISNCADDSIETDAIDRVVSRKFGETLIETVPAGSSESGNEAEIFKESVCKTFDDCIHRCVK